MMLRFTLRQLLIAVAFVSIACAALARPNYLWHATVVSAVSLAAIGMLIVAVIGSRRQRAFAAGWLVLSLGYLAIVLGPWTARHLAPQLISTQALARLEIKWHGQPLPQIFPDSAESLSVVLPADSSVNYYPTTAYMGSDLFVPVRPLVPPEPSSRYTLFQGIGHWLLAALLGQISGTLVAFLAMRHKGD